jgi:hypothetical protein
MALASCRECGKEVSTDAKTCPHCGVASPTKKPMGCGSAALVIVGMLIFMGWCANRVSTPPGGGVTEARTAESDPEGFSRYVIDQAKTHMKAQLKDPESVRWGEIKTYRVDQNGKAAIFACGTYNSKNSLGGYTGSRRFVSSGTADGTFSEEATGAGVLQGVWDMGCVGTAIVTVPGAK